MSWNFPYYGQYFHLRITLPNTNNLCCVCADRLLADILRVMVSLRKSQYFLYFVCDWSKKAATQILTNPLYLYANTKFKCISVPILEMYLNLKHLE